MNRWRIDSMDQNGMEASIEAEAAGEVQLAAADALGTLASNLDHVERSLVEVGEVVNSHADLIDEFWAKQSEVVQAINDIVDEINLLWDALDQPWYRRVFRTGRAKAHARYMKTQVGE